MHRARINAWHTGADGDGETQGRKRLRDELTEDDIDAIVDYLKKGDAEVVANVKRAVQKEADGVNARSDIKKKANNAIAYAIMRLTKRKMALDNYFDVKTHRDDGLSKKMLEYVNGKKTVDEFDEEIRQGLQEIVTTDSKKLAEKCAGYLNIEAKIAALADQADAYDLDEDKKEFLDRIDDADDRKAALAYLKHHGSTRTSFIQKMRTYLLDQRNKALQSEEIKPVLEQAKRGELPADSEYLRDDQIAENPEIYIYHELAQAIKARKGEIESKKRQDEEKKQQQRVANAAEKQEKNKKSALQAANAQFLQLVKARNDLKKLLKPSATVGGNAVSKLFKGGEIPALQINPVAWLDEMPKAVADAIDIKEELTAELQKIGTQLFLVPKAGESLQRIGLAIQNLQGNADGAEENARELLAEMNGLLAGSKS